MHKLGTRLFRRAIAAATMLLLAPIHAATFTYHGLLRDAGKPADGKYDLELTLYSAASGGGPIAGPLVMYGVPVHAGAFSTQADFASLANVSGTAWLGVKVRSAGSADFAELSARAPVSADATASVCPGAWTLDGNAGTAPGTGVGQNYLGTADNQPLVLAVSGKSVLQFNASGNATYADAPNILHGSPGNYIAVQYAGAVIGGGGSASTACGEPFTYPCINVADGLFATVAGGAGNQATNDYSTVSGGLLNVASGKVANVLGGAFNEASGDYAHVGAGRGNVASGIYSFVGGGGGNTASGYHSTIVAGDNNNASGGYSSVLSGLNNVSGGDLSFAFGQNAHVRSASEIGNGNTTGDHGTFVWSDDSSYNNFTSTDALQFLVRATNGVGLNTNAPFPDTLTVQHGGGGVAGFVPNANTAIAVQSPGSAFVEIASPSSKESGVLFNLGASSTDGSVIYNHPSWPNGLEIRTGGNNINFVVDKDGKTRNTSGTWSTLSDRRLKRDIAPIEHPLDTFLGLQGRTFEYIDPQQSMARPGRRIGFIAQDVETVLPQWISEDARSYKTVTPSGFEALSVEAVRELRAEKDAEIAMLKEKLDELTARLDRLAPARER